MQHEMHWDRDSSQPAAVSLQRLWMKVKLKARDGEFYVQSTTHTQQSVRADYDDAVAAWREDKGVAAKRAHGKRGGGQCESGEQSEENATREGRKREQVG